MSPLGLRLPLVALGSLVWAGCSELGDWHVEHNPVRANGDLGVLEIVSHDIDHDLPSSDIGTDLGVGLSARFDVDRHDAYTSVPTGLGSGSSGPFVPLVLVRAACEGVACDVESIAPVGNDPPKTVNLRITGRSAGDGKLRVQVRDPDDGREFEDTIAIAFREPTQTIVEHDLDESTSDATYGALPGMRLRWKLSPAAQLPSGELRRLVVEPGILTATSAGDLVAVSTQPVANTRGSGSWIAITANKAGLASIVLGAGKAARTVSLRVADPTDVVAAEIIHPQFTPGKLVDVTTSPSELTAARSIQRITVGAFPAQPSLREQTDDGKVTEVPSPFQVHGFRVRLKLRDGSYAFGGAEKLGPTAEGSGAYVATDDLTAEGQPKASFALYTDYSKVESATLSGTIGVATVAIPIGILRQ